MATIVILGSGVSALAFFGVCRYQGLKALIIEKEDTFGGLCNSFNIDGFTFDTFAHISFDNEPKTYKVFEGQTEFLAHESKALNYVDGLWVGHPVQNNLIELPVDERIKIIKDFLDRASESSVDNYYDWLKMHYGEYFSDNYPVRYTRKYWTVEPHNLDYKWIDGRMTTPNIEQILRGAMEKNDNTLHYSQVARYPKSGGFKQFLKPIAKGIDIRYNTIIDKIDAAKKTIFFADGSSVNYEYLISTIPLPMLIDYIVQSPDEMIREADKLDYTSGAIISLGFNKPNVSPSLWFYIYDEDIWPARVYSPDWKSPNNVPEGCSAIQAEVYFSKYKPLAMSLSELKEQVINQLLRLGLFMKEDIIVSDIRYIEYANVMFTPTIYEARERVHKYLDDLGIIYAGRWGEWDYLWMGQSYRSGVKATKKLLERMNK